MAMRYGEWLKRQRGQRYRPGFISQADLGQRIGKDRTYVNQIENGAVFLPTPETRDLIRQALGTSEDDLSAAGVLCTDEHQAIANLDAHREPMRAEACAIINRLEPRRVCAALQALQAIAEARDVGRVMFLDLPAP